MKKLAIAAVAFVLLLTAACTKGGSSGDASPGASAEATKEAASPEAAAPADPYGKYDTTVAFTMAKPDTPDNKLPAGDTLESNHYTRYTEQALNVKITHAWTAQGEGYQQKLSLAMSSGDLPDVIYVPNEKELRALAEADLLADLTDVYAQYASPLLQEYYASAGDGVALKAPTYDGKLMGLPDLNVRANGIQMIWLRQDWLDSFELQPPQSMADLIQVLKTFKEKVPGSVGLTGDPGLVGYNAIHTWNTMFSAFGSYPKQWVTGSDGKALYGSIAPETKAALANLRQMYEEGLIDPEFALRKQEDTNALIANGQSGAMFGPWWITWWPLGDSVKNDSKAEWKAYAVPLDANGTYTAPMPPANNGFIAVKKGFAHPEAAVKVLNVQQRAIVGKDDVFNQDPNTQKYKDEAVGWTNWPFNLSIDYYDAIEKRAALVNEVLDGAKTADALAEDYFAKGWYDQAVLELAEPKKDINAWAHLVVVRAAGAALESPARLHYSEFYGVTDTMSAKSATLDKLESETFLKIIFGELPLDEFDRFVADWKKLGGDEITAEVQAILDNK